MTIKDIAKAAGVSTSTVSKVLNGKDDNISDETRKRVRDIIAEFDYVPYAGVRDSLLAKNSTIAVVLPTLKSRFCLDFFEKAQSLAIKSGYTCTLYLSGPGEEREKEIIRSVSEEHTAGLLYFPGSSGALDALTESGSNISSAVLLDCDYPQRLFPRINRDFRNIAKEGTTRLLNKNNKRVALVLSSELSGASRKLIEAGYEEAHRACGVFFEKDLILEEEDREKAIGMILNAGIDGVICCDSKVAGEIHHSVRERHFSVPQDVSILCLEDDISLEHLVPAVSAVKSDPENMAKLAVDALVSQISAKKKTFFSTYLPFETVDRQSIRDYEKPLNKILVAGSINMDITMKVKRSPKLGETTLASSLNTWPGGKGANQAIGVSRFGADAFMLGRLGNDIYGKQLYEQLTKENVNLDGVAFSYNNPTGTAYISVQEDGRNTIIVNPGANARLTPTYVDSKRELFEDAVFCLLQMEIPLPSVTEILGICKEHNIKAILKPSPAQGLPEEILKGLFLMIPNREELDILVPGKGSPEEKAGKITEKGVSNVIVTLSENGCLYTDGRNVKYYDALDYPCVDATGASDIFISCLAVELSKGSDLDKAIKKATVAASYSVSKEGVQNAIIDRHLLEELYKSSFVK